MSRHVYKQFEQFGDVWFPKVSEISRYRDGSLRAEFRIEIINAQFNVAFPENFFDIDQDFYYQPRRRGPLPKTLPDSGMSPPTETDALLLLCGPQSLLKVCELLNVQSDISELLSLTGFHPNRGTTMLGLKRAATFKNLAPIGVKANVNVLRWKKVPLPAIAYVDGNHFLVAEGGGSIPFERLHAHDIYANRERTYYQSGLK